MAGSYGSKLCSLNWNSHHTTIVSVLDSLLERECLVDVTLAAEGKFINVHRFMLFACSPYFEELLTQQPKKQAVIFLKDVTFSNLQALVNFMYRGEVQIPEEQLLSFLQTAISLKIKGLLLFDREEPQPEKQASAHVPTENCTSSNIKSSPQTVVQNDRSPSKTPIRVRTSIQPIIRKTIPPSQTVAPLESTDRTVEHEETTVVEVQEHVMECQEPAVKKPRVMRRGEEPTMPTFLAKQPCCSQQQQQADSTDEPIVTEKVLEVVETEEPLLAENQLLAEEPEETTIPGEAMEAEEAVIEDNQLIVEKSQEPVQLHDSEVEAIATKQLQSIEAELQTLPAEIFESAPTEPKNEEADPVLKNENQCETVGVPAAEVFDKDVEMNDVQDEVVVINNNDTSIVTINNTNGMPSLNDTNGIPSLNDTNGMPSLNDTNGQVEERGATPENADETLTEDNLEDPEEGASGHLSRSARKPRSSLTNAKPVPTKRYSTGNAKPNICDKCGRSYAYKGSLANHMTECGSDTTYRPGRPAAPRDPSVEVHRCHMCSYSTVYRGNLKKHITCKHPDAPAEKTDA